jgi:hypothetical protein
MPTIQIPTSDELRIATELHFPHYSVQFPEWSKAKNGLEDNVPEEPTYILENHPLNCTVSLKKRIGALKGKFSNLDDVTADREDESSPNSETTDPLIKTPHPGSDTRHVDPGTTAVTLRPDFTKFMTEFKRLKTVAKTDGELLEKFDKALFPLGDAENLLGKDPKGMQRLKLIFEWALCQVVTIFGEINSALDAQSRTGYENAVKAYVELLRDLDDGEPQTKPKAPKSGVSGYGRSIKWAYIVPLIHGGRIKGTKVFAKWNPHISSSGIPIPHA